MVTKDVSRLVLVTGGDRASYFADVAYIWPYLSATYLHIDYFW
jgi:hypothetical protein